MTAEICSPGRYEKTPAGAGALLQPGIMGAALDVFEEEPLPADSPLWEFDNLLISPHICSGSNYMNKRLYDLSYRNLKAFIENGEIVNRIV